MKTLFLLFAMVVCVGAMAQSQDDIYYTKKESSPEIPKKTWKIIVKNNLSASDNFRLAGQKLIEDDFTIEKKDADFYQLKSSARQIKGINGQYFLKIIASDNQIIVTGEVKVNVEINFGYATSTDDLWDRIENKGMKGSPIRKSFEQMNDFALKLGGEISYFTD